MFTIALFGYKMNNEKLMTPAMGFYSTLLRNRTERRLTIELKSISWKNVFLLLS